MEASLENVAMTDCACGLCGLNQVRLWAFSAQTCDFSGADLSEATLRHVTLDDVRLIGTSFFRTALAGIDLTSCTLDLYQAAALARRLGVVIQE